MQNFTNAIRTLKQKIDGIGGRTFVFEKDWKKYLAEHPNRYSNNILQATWNIVDTFLKATTAWSSKIYLGTQYFEFEKWFDYLEPGTGTPIIDDDITYQLGVAFYDFLKVTTENSYAHGLLTTVGITRLTDIRDGLSERITSYQSRLAALASYEGKINASLTDASNLLSLPELNSGEAVTFAHRITLSNLPDTSARLEADRQSYNVWIEELHVYIRELVAQEKKLGLQHDNFKSTYPLPPEAETQTEKFLAVRDKAIHQLFTRHQKSKAQLVHLNELVAKAKLEQQLIIDAISGSSDLGIRRVLSDLTELIDNTSPTATPSLPDAVDNDELEHFIPNPEPIPPLTKAHLLSQLKDKFFNPDQQKIGGIFGSYLRERANTYWLRDLCSQFASLVLGCINYQTEADLRKEYLRQLQIVFTNYQTHPATYPDLKKKILAGMRDFSPRDHNGPDYLRSLHAKLKAFKRELAAINEQSPVENKELCSHPIL